MGIRRFNDPNTGRWAPVLTHISAVIGWDNKTLQQILQELIEKVDDKEAEGADDIEVWEMTPGKVYVKDGKLYISIKADSDADYEAITIGEDGLKVVGSDSTQTPSAYERDVYDNDNFVHIAEDDADFKYRAFNNPGFWFIKGDAEVNDIYNDPKIVYVDDIRLNASTGEYNLKAYAITYNLRFLVGTAAGITMEDMQWLNDDPTVIWGFASDLKGVHSIKVAGTPLQQDLNRDVNIPIASSSVNGVMSSFDKSFIDKLLLMLGGGADNYDLSDMGQYIDVGNIYDGINTTLNYYSATAEDSENAGIILSNVKQGSTLNAKSYQLLLSPQGISTRKTVLNNGVYVWENWEKVGAYDSPEFTGTPTAPTASAGTNSTQIATTAFVQNALATSLANRYPMVTLTESEYQDLVDDDEVDPDTLYVIVDNS